MIGRGWRDRPVRYPEASRAIKQLSIPGVLSTRILLAIRETSRAEDSQTQAAPTEAPCDGAIGLGESLEDGFLFLRRDPYARIFYLYLELQQHVGWRFGGDFQTNCPLPCKNLKECWS